MPKRSTTEDALDRIRAIRNEPEKYDLKRDLAPFLHHKSNHVIAAAADLVKRLEATSLTPDLISDFTELLPKAPERDQGCKALIAIAQALVNPGEHAPEVYLQGIKYIQMEGSFGPPVDAAAPLRGLCARGLVRMRHPDALYETLPLLIDRIPARLGAVQALGDSGSLEAELLLRYKVIEGDEEEIIAECFTSLLVAAPSRSVDFVGRQLQSGSEERVESAALALGESRLPAALPYLIDVWSTHANRAVRRTLLLGIGMLRQDEGVKFLLARLQDGSPQTTVDTLKALKLYENDDSVQHRIQAALRGAAS